MDKLLGFIRTTLVGGVLYLVPIVILIIVLGKALSITQRFAPAFASAIDKVQLGHILTPQVFGVLLLVVFCFLAGLFSRTALARRIGSFLDTKILINIPGYGLFRSMSAGSALGENIQQQPVLVRIEDAWQLAFLADRLDDGHLAVYVPGAPDSRSGALYFMTPDRVRALDIQLHSAFQALRRMGVGSRELLKGGIEER